MQKLKPKDTNTERCIGIEFVDSKKERDKTGSPLLTGEPNSLRFCDGGIARRIRRPMSAGANIGSASVFSL
jgi:hypothetical protein